ncbi:unnamed protein product [Rotaria sp. Silwood2]|nr:unnamed protein product [Rotaria sp. Silwood2]CAF2990695.1 unnamed protein product [Rotaria sp. Silwood2]CAF3128187.1 unnamed protein product [Rotaria sp. Silwood2]CAF3184947.1 unnamed protein product [Rotaria sp. Silwood2]CAF4020823.1 unnamed protein product [Rotaria sp. Silwood2]
MMSENMEIDVSRRNTRLIIPDSNEPDIFTPIVGYAQEPIVSLIDACIPLIPIIHNILTYGSAALNHTPNFPSNNLTRDESASICLYSMEWNGTERSLYSILNETLNKTNREGLRPWFKYLKLFLSAVAKIRCEPGRIVWRGIKKNVSHNFPRGTRVTWWAFSSCTVTLAVLENNLYLGDEGPRTLFSIETLNARNIRDHSYYANEDEILLLPGTYMEVRSKLNPASDLHIIHLKQIVPDQLLLEPPFEGKLNTLNIIKIE